jgi:hypothetical protein
MAPYSDRFGKSKERAMAANQDVNPGTVSTATPAKPGETPPPVIRYVDRPECLETFADSVTQVTFDGQSLRIEFGVTRLDEMKPNSPVTGRRLPAARIALTPLAAVDLINRMQQVAAAMTQSGLLKANPPKS